MTNRSERPTGRRGTGRVAGRLVCAILFGALSVTSGGPAAAQPPRGTTPEALRRQLEVRFDVLPLTDGFALRPKTPGRDVRWVEVTGGAITVNGTPVSGAELREKLGDDAAAVLQLSYLDPPGRAAFARQPGPEPVEAPDPVRPSTRRARTGSDQFRLGGSITVAADEVINGDVVAVGGSLTVLGQVNGDAVAIGGSLELGPGASVNDAVVIGGTFRRDPTARIRGDIVDIGTGIIDFGRFRIPRYPFRDAWWAWTVGSAFSFLATLTRVAVLCLLAALVVLIGREHVERISARAAAEPFKAGAIGVLAQLLFIPLLVITIVLLVVTIIGIPLLVLIPFVLLGLGLVALVGFTSVAHRLGGLVSLRFGWYDRGPYATTIAGILLVVSPVLLARLVALAGGFVFPMTFGLGLLGTIAEYLAWTVGFGAVALTRFGGRTAADAIL